LLLSVVATTGLASVIDDARSAAVIAIAAISDIFELFIIFLHGFSFILKYQVSNPTPIIQSC
jgi:hypothetical protein